MPDVPKHAWTHRPRSQGGTDPIDIVLPDSSAPAIQHPPIFKPLHQASTGGTRVFLPNYRKFPGGIVATNALPWAQNFAVGDNTSGRPSDGIRDNQTAADASAADVSVSVRPIADLDLVPGIPYHIYVGYRSDATATNPQISVSVTYAGTGTWLTGSNGSITDKNVFNEDVSASTNLVDQAQDWYGYTPVGDDSYASANMWNFDADNDLVQFKCFKTGGTGFVYLGWMLFVPALDVNYPLVFDGASTGDSYADIVNYGEGSEYYFAGQTAVGPTAAVATDNSGGFFDRTATLVDTQRVTAPYQALPSENGLGKSSELASRRHGYFFLLTFARAHSETDVDDAYGFVAQVYNHAIGPGVIVDKSWVPVCLGVFQWQESEFGVALYGLDTGGTLPDYLSETRAGVAPSDTEVHLQRYHYVSVSNGSSP